jgi:GT2 family glycosyltransferase
MGYRDEDTICSAVRSVLEQDHEGATEVLVVTSGGDRSAELVRAFCPGVRVFDSAERLLPGAARNTGVRAATGEFVAFIAADCRAAPAWASSRLAAHGAGYAAVAGAVEPEPPANAPVWASHYLLFPSRLAGGRSEAIAFPDDRAHGLSFARSLLERMGPFREDMRIGEDTDMARRLEAEGVPIWLAADAVITHGGPRRVGALIRDQYARGIRDARFAGPPRGRWLKRTRVVAGAVRGLWLRVRWAQGRVFALAPGHRRNVIRVLPCMIAGTIGHQAGWVRGRIGASAPPARRA